MKQFSRTTLGALAAVFLGAALYGCPKKAPQAPDAQQPKVSESIVTTRPGAGKGAAEQEAARRSAAEQEAARKAEEQRLAQLLAARGEDIPIKEAPAIEFVAPAAEDRAILAPIYFDYDKSNIRPEFQPVLEGIAKWLAAKPERQLLVEGHCDERGTDEYNLALGERRALSVRRYLVALGVAAERLHTISYGEEKPADPGHDEAAWSRNRRSEFKVSAP